MLQSMMSKDCIICMILKDKMLREMLG